MIKIKTPINKLIPLPVLGEVLPKRTPKIDKIKIDINNINIFFIIFIVLKLYVNKLIINC